MRFVIKINNENTLFALEYNGKFVRHIKLTEFDTLASEVSKWFADIGTEFTLKVAQEYDLPMSSEQEAELTSLLENGKDKKAIKLPEKLGYSPLGLRVIFSSRDVSSFAKYWETNSYDKQFALFEQLSQDLMEVPYIDEPHDQLSLRDKVVYHPNHGTTHGLRQYALSRQYLELIKQKGNSVFSEQANSLTIEEQACLRLAAFLFRVGRTNELGWGSDSSYGPRSAAIFKQIALELDFSPDLVEKLTLSFDYHQDFSKRTDISAEDINKILLFTKILKLSHDSDLVRCFEEEEKVKAPIVEELYHLLDEQENCSEIADSFMSYVADLCRLTGSKIALNSLRRETGDEMYADLKGNARLAIEFASPAKAKEKMYLLLPLRPSIFPTLKAPTESWLEDPKHDASLEAAKWTMQDREAMPTQACIEQEVAYLHTHVSVYHATTKFSYVLDLFCRELRGLLEKPNNTAWIRGFNGVPPGRKYKDLSEILERQKESQVLDNEANMSWHLLSSNPSLWQNSDVASEESTIDFFHDNNSVIKLNFSELINELLDKEGLLLNQPEDRNEICKRFLELCNNEAFGTKGAIYQYFIPLHLVESTAYISKQNGVFDEENSSALDTLLALKYPEQRVPNHNTLQVRLFVPNLLDERYTEGHIIVKNHLGMDDDLRGAFEKTIRNLAHDVMKRTHEITKPVAKTEPRWAMSSQTFFGTGSPWKWRASVVEKRAMSSETAMQVMEEPEPKRIHLDISDEPCLLFTEADDGIFHGLK